MDIRPRTGGVALATACLALLAGCGSSGKHVTGLAPATPTVTSTQTPTTKSTQASGTTTLPTSCGGLPLSLIGTDLGGIATTTTLKNSASGVTCEFANAGASKLLIVTVGHGSAAVLDQLRTQTGATQTVTPVNGFEAGAFTVSKNGAVRGLTAVTAGGLLVVVSSTFPVAEDEALIQQIAGG